MCHDESETFIASEIRALEERGVPLRIYSYRRPREAVPHQVVQRIRARITYLPEPLHRHPRALWRAHREALRLDRARHRRTLELAVRRALSERSLAAWRGFLRALVLATHVRSDGVRHLHAHFAHGASDAAMLASGLVGQPFSFTAHARDIYTAPPERLRQKIEAAAAMLDELRIRRLPVVANGRLEGIVSRADLIKMLARPPDQVTSPPADAKLVAIFSGGRGGPGGVKWQQHPHQKA